MGYYEIKNVETEQQLIGTHFKRDPRPEIVARFPGAEFSTGPRNLYNALLDAKTAPNQAYFYSPHGPISYGQMREMSVWLGQYLRRNVKATKNPILAVSMNDAEHILYLAWACLASGICLAFLPLSRDPAHVRSLMDQLGAAALVSDIPTLQAESLPIPYETLKRGDFTGEPISIPNPGPDTPAMIFQTSGTTGAAKWIQATHGQCLSAIESMQRVGSLEHARDQVVYITSPLSHSFGLSSLLEYTSMGSSIILPRGDSPLGAVGELSNPALAGVVTAVEGVPYFYRQMARLIKRIKLPVLRHAGLGGGGLNLDVVNRIRSVYPALSYSVRYGMTETPSVISHKLFTFPYTDDWGSSGRVLPIYDLRVVDETGQVLGTGQEGEIQIRGRSLAWPYYGEEECDDFFPTGDLGYLNADRELCIIGRKSQYLKIQGYRISPEYVESAIGAFEGVLDCRVSISNANLLAEVARGDNSFLARDLLNFLAQKLPGYAIPKSVTFVEAIPRTPSGKIKRH